MKVLVPMEAGLYGLRETIQDLVALFYADDGLVSSPRPERLQRAFNVLTDIFDWFVLCTNLRKMVIMACCPCYTPSGFLGSD